MLPAPRVPDGPTISPSPFRKQAGTEVPADLIPDNGQAERMNRTIKDATIKTYHYDDLENLKAHVMAFVTAYNFAKHLKALK